MFAGWGGCARTVSSSRKGHATLHAACAKLSNACQALQNIGILCAQRKGDCERLNSCAEMRTRLETHLDAVKLEDGHSEQIASTQAEDVDHVLQAVKRVSKTNRRSGERRLV